MCISYQSKVLMYEFHYDYMKKKYGNKSRLLFTDIDTLIYEIKIEHVYKDLRKVEEMCDFSSHSAKSKYYNDSNNLVFAKM